MWKEQRKKSPFPPHQLWSFGQSRLTESRTTAKCLLHVRRSAGKRARTLPGHAVDYVSCLSQLSWIAYESATCWRAPRNDRHLYKLIPREAFTADQLIGARNVHDATIARAASQITCDTMHNCASRFYYCPIGVRNAILCANSDRTTDRFFSRRERLSQNSQKQADSHWFLPFQQWIIYAALRKNRAGLLYFSVFFFFLNRLLDIVFAPISQLRNQFTFTLDKYILQSVAIFQKGPQKARRGLHGESTSSCTFLFSF